MNDTVHPRPITAPTPGRWEWLFKLSPVLLVLLTGAFYLNGVAFHQGIWVTFIY